MVVAGYEMGYPGAGFGGMDYTSGMMPDMGIGSIYGGQEKFINQQFKSMEAQERGQISIQARNDAIIDQATSVKSMILMGENDQVVPEFNELVSELRNNNVYKNLSEKQLRAQAKKFYAQVNGQSIESEVAQNTSGAFWQGIKQGVPVIGTFFADKKCKEEIIAELSGTKVPKGVNTKKAFGGILSGAACGAAIGTWIPIPGVGTITGAVVGGVMGLVNSLFGSKS